MPLPARVARGRVIADPQAGRAWAVEAIDVGEA
jgi:hypothetical protein